jgi:hypothetical protein
MFDPLLQSGKRSTMASVLSKIAKEFWHTAPVVESPIEVEIPIEHDHPPFDPEQGQGS